MAVHWKKQLADSHHEARRLKNRIHELEVKLAAAEAVAVEQEQRAMEIARRLAASEAAAAQTRPNARPMTDTEIQMLSGYCFLEVLPSTPARRSVQKVIMDALVARGLLCVEDLS